MKKYEELEQKIKELQQEVNRLKAEEEKPDTLPLEFHIDCILDFLKNPDKVEKLLRCFKWNSTSQGDSYWHRIYNEKQPLTDKDIIQIQKWVILYYQQNLNRTN